MPNRQARRNKSKNKSLVAPRPISQNFPAPKPSVTLTAQHTTFSGPVPHPEMIKAYEDAVPGSGATIFQQFSAQGDHRREQEKAELAGALKLQSRGQIFGFILALVAMLSGFVLLVLDKPVSGFITLLGTAITLATVYFRSKKSGHKELAEKANEIVKRNQTLAPTE